MGSNPHMHEREHRQTGWTRVFLLAALLLLPATLMGCEYPGVAHPLAAKAASLVPTVTADELEPTPTAIPEDDSGAGHIAGDPTPDDAAPGDPTPDDPTPDDAAPAEVEVSLRDFELDPSDLVARAGTVKFILTNKGRYTHDFRVEGEGVDEKAPKVGRGRTFEWTVDLEPGTYVISCPVSNHASRGMTGTLTVEK